MPVFAQPGTEGSPVTYRDRYDNWIGGEYVAPVKGQYFENISPVDGKVFCEIARGDLEMLAVGETWDNGKPVRETVGGVGFAGATSPP